MARCNEPFVCEIFYPTQVFVVLGSSNEAHKECYLERCVQDDIPVLRRLGGGGAVVLYPGSLVVSVGAWVDDLYNNHKYFKVLNAAIMSSLEALMPGLKGTLTTSGISDIAWCDKKIAGTSLFRSRYYLLYQASLLVGLSGSEVLSTYLKHPTKEPPYRGGRSHGEFLQFLETFSSVLMTREGLDQFRGYCHVVMRESLETEGVHAPSPEEVVYVKKRAALLEKP